MAKLHKKTSQSNALGGSLYFKMFQRFLEIVKVEVDEEFQIRSLP